MDISYEPFFSVIIPTYNSAKTISRALQSVLTQTFSNFEILVIDGASADDTLAQTTAFKSNKITPISEKDKGVYDAMNKGIKLAKGQWLYFLGSDDALYDGSILEKISALIQKHPKSRIVFGDVFTSNGTVERFPNYGFIELLDRCVCHQAIFYHRSLFEDREYSLQYQIASDWDFNMQVFTRQNHPLYTPELIARYNLEGLSGNWQQHPDYLDHFADKKTVITRYKGRRNLYFYYGWYYLKYYWRKIKRKLGWMSRS
jgi:glycosyltransferase involved in cell wall biosynthesis